jgi:transposase
MGVRKQHPAEFKAPVAVEAIRGDPPLHAVASPYGVPPVQVAQGKRPARAARPAGFASRRGRAAAEAEARQARRDQAIGQRTGERDWLNRQARWVA